MKPDEAFAAISIATIVGGFAAFVAITEMARRRALALARREAAKLPGLRPFPVRHQTGKAHESSALASSIGVLAVGPGRLVYVHRRYRWGESSTFATSGGDADLMEIPLEGLTIARKDEKVSWLALSANGKTHYFRPDRVLVFGTVELAKELEREIDGAIGQAPPVDPLTVAPDEGGPLLVVRRREPVEIWRVGLTTVWGLIAAGALGGLAWARDAFPTSIFHRYNQLFGFGAIAATGAAVFVARRLLASRAGQAVLYEDRVVVSKKSDVTLPWSELAGYRDGSADYVQLVRKGERLASPELAIPTPGERERTALLAILDRKGLERLES